MGEKKSLVDAGGFKEFVNDFVDYASLLFLKVIEDNIIISKIKRYAVSIVPL